MTAVAPRAALPVLAVFFLVQCSTTPQEGGEEGLEAVGTPKIERLEHAKLDHPADDGEEPLKFMDDSGDGPVTAGLPPVAGREGRFVIRDPKGSKRVEGQLKGGRMDGLWKYYDAAGSRLAEVHYRADQRHGEAALFYVSSDGKAAGRRKMTATYQEGSLHGFARNWHGSGGKFLEREFDQGILQGCRGWREDGQEMSDGGAQRSGLDVSRSEESLLAELESFVQLKIRQNAGSAAPAGASPQSAP